MAEDVTDALRSLSNTVSLEHRWFKQVQMQ